jgi:hypothetical protein
MGQPRPVSGTGFIYALVGGFVLAVFTLGIVNAGHCLGDPTPEVLACRAAQRRTGLVFPVLYVAVTGFAVLRHRRGLEGAAGLAIFAGPLAAVGAMLVNAFAR